MDFKLSYIVGKKMPGLNFDRDHFSKRNRKGDNKQRETGKRKVISHNRKT